MSHCEENCLDQFILPPDTCDVRQKNKQINQHLHSNYEEKNSDMYAHLNRNCFMDILVEIWNQWETPDRILKAERCV
jgi:hypothetical protein